MLKWNAKLQFTGIKPLLEAPRMSIACLFFTRIWWFEMCDASHWHNHHVYSITFSLVLLYFFSIWVFLFTTNFCTVIFVQSLICVFVCISFISSWRGEFVFLSIELVFFFFGCKSFMLFDLFVCNIEHLNVWMSLYKGWMGEKYTLERNVLDSTRLTYINKCLSKVRVS